MPASRIAAFFFVTIFFACGLFSLTPTTTYALVADCSVKCKRPDGCGNVKYNDYLYEGQTCATDKCGSSVCKAGICALGGSSCAPPDLDVTPPADTTPSGDDGTDSGDDSTDTSPPPPPKLPPPSPKEPAVPDDDTSKTPGSILTGLPKTPPKDSSGAELNKELREALKGTGLEGFQNNGDDEGIPSTPVKEKNLTGFGGPPSSETEENWYDQLVQSILDEGEKILRGLIGVLGIDTRAPIPQEELDAKEDAVRTRVEQLLKEGKVDDAAEINIDDEIKKIREKYRAKEESRPSTLTLPSKEMTPAEIREEFAKEEKRKKDLQLPLLDEWAFPEIQNAKSIDLPLAEWQEPPAPKPETLLPSELVDDFSVNCNFGDVCISTAGKDLYTQCQEGAPGDAKACALAVGDLIKAQERDKAVNGGRTPLRALAPLATTPPTTVSEPTPKEPSLFKDPDEFLEKHKILGPVYRLGKNAIKGGLDALRSPGSQPQPAPTLTGTSPVGAPSSPPDQPLNDVDRDDLLPPAPPTPDPHPGFTDAFDALEQSAAEREADMRAKIRQQIEDELSPNEGLAFQPPGYWYDNTEAKVLTENLLPSPVPEKSLPLADTVQKPEPGLVDKVFGPLQDAFGNFIGDVKKGYFAIKKDIFQLPNSGAEENPPTLRPGPRPLGVPTDNVILTQPSGVPLPPDLTLPENQDVQISGTPLPAVQEPTDFGYDAELDVEQAKYEADQAAKEDESLAFQPPGYWYTDTEAKVLTGNLLPTPRLGPDAMAEALKNAKENESLAWEFPDTDTNPNQLVSEGPFSGAWEFPDTDTNPNQIVTEPFQDFPDTDTNPNQTEPLVSNTAAKSDRLPVATKEPFVGPLQRTARQTEQYRLQEGIDLANARRPCVAANINAAAKNGAACSKALDAYNGKYPDYQISQGQKQAWLVEGECRSGAGPICRAAQKQLNNQNSDYKISDGLAKTYGYQQLKTYADAKNVAAYNNLTRLQAKNFGTDFDPSKPLFTAGLRAPGAAAAEKARNEAQSKINAEVKRLTAAGGYDPKNPSTWSGTLTKALDARDAAQKQLDLIAKKYGITSGGDYNHIPSTNYNAAVKEINPNLTTYGAAGQVTNNVLTNAQDYYARTVTPGSVLDQYAGQSNLEIANGTGQNAIAARETYNELMNSVPLDASGRPILNPQQQLSAMELNAKLNANIGAYQLAVEAVKVNAGEALRQQEMLNIAVRAKMQEYLNNPAYDMFGNQYQTGRAATLADQINFSSDALAQQAIMTQRGLDFLNANSKIVSPVLDPEGAALQRATEKGIKESKAYLEQIKGELASNQVKLTALQNPNFGDLYAIKQTPPVLSEREGQVRQAAELGAINDGAIAYKNAIDAQRAAQTNLDAQRQDILQRDQNPDQVGSYTRQTLAAAERELARTTQVLDAATANLNNTLTDNFTPYEQNKIAKALAEDPLLQTRNDISKLQNEIANYDTSPLQKRFFGLLGSSQEELRQQLVDLQSKAQNIETRLTTPTGLTTDETPPQFKDIGLNRPFTQVLEGYSQRIQYYAGKISSAANGLTGISGQILSIPYYITGEFIVKLPSALIESVLALTGNPTDQRIDTVLSSSPSDIAALRINDVFMVAPIVAPLAARFGKAAGMLVNELRAGAIDSGALATAPARTAGVPLSPAAAETRALTLDAEASNLYKQASNLDGQAVQAGVDGKPALQANLNAQALVARDAGVVKAIEAQILRETALTRAAGPAADPGAARA
ncbi:MAG: hypothetical protein Q8R25_03495, partial [bacterium]|nr:hypothetical protein [bacterium]